MATLPSGVWVMLRLVLEPPEATEAPAALAVSAGSRMAHCCLRVLGQNGWRGGPGNPKKGRGPIQAQGPLLIERNPLAPMVQETYLTSP